MVFYKILLKLNKRNKLFKIDLMELKVKPINYAKGNFHANTDVIYERGSVLFLSVRSRIAHAPLLLCIFNSIFKSFARLICIICIGEWYL